MVTYVPIDDAPFKLKFRPGDLPPFGRFFFTRMLWRIYPTGGHWLAHSVFYFVLILATVLLFVLDILVLLGWLIWKIFRWLLIGLGLLLWRLFESLFTAVIYPGLKTAIIVIALVIILIIVFYRFDFIRDSVLKIFDQWLAR